MITQIQYLPVTSLDADDVSEYRSRISIAQGEGALDYEDTQRLLNFVLLCLDMIEDAETKADEKAADLESTNEALTTENKDKDERIEELEGEVFELNECIEGHEERYNKVVGQLEFTTELLANEKILTQRQSEIIRGQNPVHFK